MSTSTTVQNIRDGTYDSSNPEHVYIGRRNLAYRVGTSEFHNPFPMRYEAERAGVIEAYRAYLLRSPALLAKVRTLRGKTLYCFCAPKACHGDVLSKLADRALK